MRLLKKVMAVTLCVMLALGTMPLLLGAVDYENPLVFDDFAVVSEGAVYVGQTADSYPVNKQVSGCCGSDDYDCEPAGGTQRANSEREYEDLVFAPDMANYDVSAVADNVDFELFEGFLPTDSSLVDKCYFCGDPDCEDFNCTCYACLEVECQNCGIPGRCRVPDDCESPTVVSITIPTPVVGAAKADFGVEVIPSFFKVYDGTTWDSDRETFQDESYTKIVYLRAGSGYYFHGDEYEPVVVIVNGRDVAFERINYTSLIKGRVVMTSIEKDADLAVTFDLRGGNIGAVSGYYTRSVSYGTRITPPQNPTRGGFYFHGWYTTQVPAPATAASFPAAVTTDRTFYARWEAFAPEIYRIDISPAFVAVSPGDVVIFEAQVFGGANPHQGITWTISGFTCNQTYIVSGSGRLTAGPNETGIITVTATSLINPAISGTAEARSYCPSTGDSTCECCEVCGLPDAECVCAATSAAHNVPQTGISSWTILPMILGVFGLVLTAGAEIFRRHGKNSEKGGKVLTSE